MEPKTLCELFFQSVDTFRKPAHLRVKRDGAWRDISSAAFLRSVEELSMGLRALGVERGDRVAILSENRPEWAYADLATLCAGAIDAPIYASLTPAQVLYILNDSGAKVVFVSNASQAAKVAEVRDRAPELRHVIAMDPLDAPGVLSLAAVAAEGAKALEEEPGAVRARAAEARPEDVFTLIYTSGTTGDPKGVMLTHDNMVSNILAGTKVFSDWDSNDVTLSFLPLCHVFERMGGHYLMLHAGATIAYAESVEKVPQNMIEVKPTLMFSVPRLYEKIYARVHERVAADPPTRQRIFHWAIGVGRESFRHALEGTKPGLVQRLKHAAADALVLSKIRERTGGRLRLFVSGGAPLAREIAEFFGAVGLTVLEGYGLTETSPVITVNRPERIRPGSVGQPVEGVEVRIAEDGEILTRGRHVMKGYYNKPEATAEAIDKEGWFHTGDIGALDGEGYLTITDRKKDILVTSGGKNIAPQPIENRIKTNAFVAEVVMVGDKRNYPSALVVPNFDSLERWARGKGLPIGSREELVACPEVKAHFKEVLDSVGADLAQFERIKKFALLTKEFTIEAGELTPTMKVKRRVVEQLYKDVIDRLYQGAA